MDRRRSIRYDDEDEDNDDDDDDNDDDDEEEEEEEKVMPSMDPGVVGEVGRMVLGGRQIGDMEWCGVDDGCCLMLLLISLLLLFYDGDFQSKYV
jgi:hypothetical protein